MNNHLSAELLQFLLQLYEQGSLSKACSRLGISQPAGSRLLSTLREIFHDELFLKTRTGMVPSERCERLIPNAEKTLQSLLALTQEEIFDPARLTKNFRLGIVDNAFFSIFLPVVNEIQRAAPGVTFEIPDIRFSALTKYVDYLSSNEVDLLIYPYKDSEVPKSVRFFKLFEDHFVYITRKGHPLEKVPPEEIHLHKVSILRQFSFCMPCCRRRGGSSRNNGKNIVPMVANHNLQNAPTRGIPVLSDFILARIQKRRPCQPMASLHHHFSHKK